MIFCFVYQFEVMMMIIRGTVKCQLRLSSEIKKDTHWCQYSHEWQWRFLNCKGAMFVFTTTTVVEWP